MKVLTADQIQSLNAQHVSIEIVGTPTEIRCCGEVFALADFLTHNARHA